MPADWQLPPGVSRTLWDYVHDRDVAREYDASLSGAPLLTFDTAFVMQHCKPSGRVLDLGCGTGRLSIRLAQAGYQPVGVDLSAPMLGVLHEKARELRLSIPCAVANIADLGCFADASFDHAACLFSTLGLIVGADARRRVLQHTWRILRPGGVFALHVHNRWFNAWTAPGRRLLARDLFDTVLGRAAPGDYLMPPHHGAGSLTMHLFTRREISAMLREAGFDIIEIRRISLQRDGRLSWPWFIPALRTYGFLIAARKP